MGLDPSEHEGFHLLVSREEWGARPASGLPRLNLPVSKVRYTHTNTDECTTESECLEAVRDIQRNHMLKGFDDVKYNFLVGGDCRVYEGRGWHFEGEITKLNNEKKQQTIDFGFIGYYSNVEKNIIPEMTDVARGLVEWGIRRHILKIPIDVEQCYDE